MRRPRRDDARHNASAQPRPAPPLSMSLAMAPTAIVTSFTAGGILDLAPWRKLPN